VSSGRQTVDVLAGGSGGEVLAFRVDGVGFRWSTVFADARRRGDWQILEAEVRQALACAQLVAEGAPPLGREVERSAANAFRRARRLHAAEDVEAWLGARGLTVRQWRRYVRGEALRLRHAAELADLVARYPADDATVHDTLPIWGWCSGAFPRWAEALAARAATAAALGETGDTPDGSVDLRALDERFDRFAAETATPDRLAALVAARYLAWLRIDGDLVAFADEDTAREALLCVREDGWSLADVAAAAKRQLRRRALLAEEVDVEVRHHLVRARDGDLLGPLLVDGRPTLVFVRRKRPPEIDDEEVRVRATRELVDTAVAREVADRVEWLHPR
jgi:hypothetical protein